MVRNLTNYRYGQLYHYYVNEEYCRNEIKVHVIATTISIKEFIVNFVSPVEFRVRSP